MPTRRSAEAVVDGLDVVAFTIPTDGVESDGTLEWSSTTLVLVTARSGETRGYGYSYTHRGAADLIENVLAERVVGCDAMALPAIWTAMVAAVRNFGRPGVCSTAVAAVDTALWDLKARLLDVPLATLFGRARAAIPVYGSGGFTSDDYDRLAQQLRDWVARGISMVKIKIGRDPDADRERLQVARDAVGGETQLFVDANGAFDRKQALAMAVRMAEADVRWFEEPVSSDDLEGLRLIRDRAPAAMEVTAGEYGYDVDYFRRMLTAGAVDVLQADATRCAGYTGFLRAASVCAAHHVPLSAHTAANLHAHVCCAVPECRHVELFYDHARIETLLFDGVLEPHDGELTPDLQRSGNGLSLKSSAAAYQVYGKPLGESV